MTIIIKITPNCKYVLALTFKGNGFQDAKLLENGHENDDNDTDGKQLHALDPHDFSNRLRPSLIEII